MIISNSLHSSARQLLIAVICLAAFISSSQGASDPVPAQPCTIEQEKWVPLFPQAKKDPRPEAWTKDQRITNVFNPQIQFYFPKEWKSTDKRTFVCIFPGGGYAYESLIMEGADIAKWLNSMGIVSAVVKYRVSLNDRATGLFPGPLLDARRAVRFSRAEAHRLGINPQKIGVIGFSAGGHLAAMATTLWNKTLKEEQEDSLLKVSARPDFSMLIYPVITMDSSITHKGTQRSISGANPSPELLKICSPEKQVTPQTPPVFLVHAKNDGVSCQNSELMEKACLQHRVPVKKVLYENGGHGYGIQKRGTATDAWPNDAKQWLISRNLISPADQ